jgi:hypothetical protein
MIRSIALFSACLVLCLAAATLRADEPPEPPPLKSPATLSFAAPTSWSLLPGLSKTVSQSASEADFFGEDEPFESGAMAYGRANRGALYVTWIDSLRTQPVAEAAIRNAFDELHEAPYLASPEAGSTQEVSYRERIFDGVAEMRFEWAHMSNGTVNVVRVLGWKDSEARVHLAVAECVLQSESIGESRPFCDTALESLVLTKEAAHETLAGLPEPTSVGARAPEYFVVPKLKTSENLPSDSLGVAPSQMGEVLYKGRPKSKSDNNNRTIIAIGVLLLAAAFYLTTRSTPTPSDEDEEDSESGSEAEVASNEHGEDTSDDDGDGEPSDEAKEQT